MLRSILANRESDRIFHQYYPNASTPASILGFIPPYYGSVVIRQEGLELLGVLTIVLWILCVKMFRSYQGKIQK